MNQNEWKLKPHPSCTLSNSFPLVSNITWLSKEKRQYNKQWIKTRKNKAQSLPKMLQRSGNGHLLTLSLFFPFKFCYLASTLFLSVPSNKWSAPRKGRRGSSSANLELRYETLKKLREGNFFEEFWRKFGVSVNSMMRIFSMFLVVPKCRFR